MISGLLTLILITATTTGDATNDLENLVAALAPQSDGTTLHFTQQRESSLLEEPLVVRGKLWRTERGVLVRETTEPGREIQKLHAGKVVIEQPGGRTREFRLGRAPELAVLRHALTAILSGDADALRQHFEHQLERDDAGWRLTLMPLERELANRVTTLSISGTGSTIERFELSLADGETITTELNRQP